MLEQPALNKISSLDEAQCIDGDGAKAKCTKTLISKCLRVLFLFFNEICGCATRHEGESRTRADAGCIVNYTLLGFVLPSAHSSISLPNPMPQTNMR